MGRSPCCDESTGLKKGPWTPEEDDKLVKYIQKHGHGSWRALPKLAGLNRCGKSCRLRWTNYLRPDIKRGTFSQEEEQTILRLHSMLGNKWSAIASHLKGRTDNEIKNFWNTHLKKKLIQSGIDPMTHQPRTDIFSSLPNLIALANLKEFIAHYSMDEHAIAMRLQAEAAQFAKLQCLQYLLQPPCTSTANNLSDLETYNYLNSLPSFNDAPVAGTSQTLDSTTINSSLQGCGTILDDISIPFSHMPDLQPPYETLNKDHMLTVISQDFNSPRCSPWQQQLPVDIINPSLPLMTQTNSPINSLGDASTTSGSSHGGGEAPASSFSPDHELLFETFSFHEI